MASAILHHHPAGNWRSAPWPRWYRQLAVPLPQGDYPRGRWSASAASSSARAWTRRWTSPTSWPREHLEIVTVDDPCSYIGRLDNAGSVFLGHLLPRAPGGLFRRPQPRAAHRRHRPASSRPCRWTTSSRNPASFPTPGRRCRRGRARNIQTFARAEELDRPRQFHPGAGGGLRRRPCTS